MDASKLLKVLIDLTSDIELEINKTLLNFIQTFNGKSGFDIQRDIMAFEELFAESLVNNYNPSNIKIAKNIGAYYSFGEYGYMDLESLAEYNQKDISKALDGVRYFYDNRIEYMNLLNTTRDNLIELGIKPHEYTDDTFEVGILMPERATQNKISRIFKDLDKWDKLFKTLKELNGESIEDTKLSFINNGSLEFFVENSPQVALTLALIIEKVTKAISHILDIKRMRDELKKHGALTVNEQKTLDKTEKDIFDKNLESIADSVINEFAKKQIDSGRINELKVAVKGHVKFVAKCLDNGILIEINPPDHSTEDSESENKAVELKENKKLKDENLIKKIDLISKAMSSVKSISETGSEIIKYLSEGEDDQNVNTEVKDDDLES